MIRLLTGDCRAILPTLPAQSVHCCVTSPPYFGLRDYGTAIWQGGDVECPHKPSPEWIKSQINGSSGLHGGFDNQAASATKRWLNPDGSCRCGAVRVDSQIGLEPTPQAYVEQLVAVFREVRRVLRDDGTLWLNLGDSYAGGGSGGGGSYETERNWRHGSGRADGIVDERGQRNRDGLGRINGLSPKNLIGIPWRVAFALQADGWYLRQDIIWAKPNPMPESVTDRCTKAHEYIFLLSKNARYYYDADAIREPAQDRPFDAALKTIRPNDTEWHDNRYAAGASGYGNNPNGRNKRSVWEIATQPYSEAHFATFPPALIEPCILAGCPEKCCAKCGAPWERQVERTAMVIDRSERTHDLGRTRSSGTMLEPAKAITVGSLPSCQCNVKTMPGTVLDPFSGAGTTGLVADRHNRNALLIELNPSYSAMGQTRIQDDAPLFVQTSLNI